MAKTSGGTRPQERTRRGGKYQLKGDVFTSGNYYSDAKTEEIKKDLKSILQEVGIKVKLGKSDVYDEEAKYEGKVNNGIRNTYNEPAAFFNARGKTASEDISIRGTGDKDKFLVDQYYWHHASDGESWTTKAYEDMYLSRDKVIKLIKKSIKGRKIGDYIGQ